MNAMEKKKVEDDEILLVIKHAFIPELRNCLHSLFLPSLHSCAVLVSLPFLFLFSSFHSFSKVVDFLCFYWSMQSNTYDTPIYIYIEIRIRINIFFLEKTRYNIKKVIYKKRVIGEMIGVIFATQWIKNKNIKYILHCIYYLYFMNLVLNSPF